MTSIRFPRRNPVRHPIRSLPAVCLLLTLVSPLLAEGNASRVNELLVKLRAPRTSSQTEQLKISEEDLNAWAAVVTENKSHLGLRKLQVDLLGLNRVRALAEIDMDQVKMEGFSAQLFKSTLSGIQNLVAEGRLQIEGNQASFSVEEASFNGIPVPAWLVTQVLSYLSTRQPPNIDVTEPFPLPYGIRDIQLLPDSAVITR